MPRPDTSRPAFAFDPDLCTGCEACRIACGIENNEGRDIGWRSVTTFNPSRHPALPTTHLSLACNHCDVPACALGCPASAYQRNEATGAVILDPEKCIGCRYCSWVCPYDAPTFDEDDGVMTKCTFCSPRLMEGREPACTQACPTNALRLGSRSPLDPEPSHFAVGNFGLGPALEIRGSIRRGPPPSLAIDSVLEDRPSQPLPRRKITARSEWTLVAFTTGMPALVAWFAGGAVHSTRAPGALVFLAIAVMLMAVSTAHLGRPARAWRAILNVRTSWLSREVLFANFFVFFGMAYLLFPHASLELALPGLVSGLALCFSIDQVYRKVIRPGARYLHSSDALLTLVFLSGIAASAPLVTWMAAAVKAILFVGRGWDGRRGVDPTGGIARVALIVAACLIPSWSIAFSVAILGESIDRWSFYEELEPTSPARRAVESMEMSPGLSRPS